MDFMKIFKWLAENYDMVLQSLVVILGALGLIAETFARIFPGSESALTKVGKAIAKLGEYVKKVLDFLKVPDNKPKE